MIEDIPLDPTAPGTEGIARHSREAFLTRIGQRPGASARCVPLAVPNDALLRSLNNELLRQQIRGYGPCLLDDFLHYVVADSLIMSRCPKQIVSWMEEDKVTRCLG